MPDQLQRNDASHQGQGQHDSNSGSRPSMSDLRSDAATLSADVKHIARDAAAVVKDGASSTAQDLKHRAEGAHEQVCGYVKANPTASILIALGVGAILGRLLR